MIFGVVPAALAATRVGYVSEPLMCSAPVVRGEGFELGQKECTRRGVTGWKVEKE